MKTGEFKNKWENIENPRHPKKKWEFKNTWESLEDP